MTFPANILSASPPKYLFKLISENQTIVCDPEPLEWSEGTFTMNRDLAVGGVFGTFMDSLTFVGNGAELLRNLWNAYEFNSECELAIYYFKNSIREYKEFPFRFAINFNVYEVVKVGNFAFGIRVKAVNNSLQTKFDNRKDVDVDVTKLISVGEVALQDYGYGFKKYINFDAVNQKVYAKMYSNMARTWQGPVGSGYWSGNWDLPRTLGSNSYTTIPLNVVSSDYSECTDTVYQTRLYSLISCSPFFINAKFAYAFSVNYRISVSVINQNSVTAPWTIQIIETDYNNNIITTTEVATFGIARGVAIIEGTLDLTMTKGNSLRFVIVTGNISGIKALLNNATIELTQTIATSPVKKVTGIPIYDAFEWLLRDILDTQWPFYSDYFGRTDTWKNNSWQFYASENQLRFAHVSSGLNLRGLDINDPSNTLVLNFKNLFKTATSIWNLGYTFEYDNTAFGDDSLRLRIEEYSHFFDATGSPVLDLSARINKYDIISMAMPELAPVQIDSGFNNFEYLELNGRAEPNTTSKRTSKVNTDTKMDNISPLRGDTKGIYSALSAPIDTTDIKSDQGIFIIKTQRTGANEWQPEKAENITIENSIFGNDQLNRYFTPSRMLRRNANRITPAFTTDDLKASKLTFQTSDKLQTIKTTGEGYTMIENEDILISDLESPIYKPMKHTVECSLDYTELEAIIEQPFKWIKFSDTISGFLLNLKKKNNEAKAEITIIEKYVS